LVEAQEGSCHQPAGPHHRFGPQTPLTEIWQAVCAQSEVCSLREDISISYCNGGLPDNEFK